MITSGVIAPTDTLKDLRAKLAWFTEEWKSARGGMDRGKWMNRAEKVQAEIDKRTNNKQR